MELDFANKFKNMSKVTFFLLRFLVLSLCCVRDWPNLY